jgi:hypothetical protein
MAIDEARPASEERDLAPIGKLLFEDDRVAVWSLELEPGQSTGWHRHDHPYLMIVLEGEAVVAEFESGMDEIEAPTPPGRVMYSDTTANSQFGVENAHNRTSTRFREIVVELKGSEQPVEYAQADAFDT